MDFCFAQPHAQPEKWHRMMQTFMGMFERMGCKEILPAVSLAAADGFDFRGDKREVSLPRMGNFSPRSGKAAVSTAFSTRCFIDAHFA
ncbi:hypothetical protein DEA98_27140 [Brucella pseudogrignonensis]|nr:hypothetical protein [Brucella pseudogrignonensis]